MNGPPEPWPVEHQNTGNAEPPLALVVQRFLSNSGSAQAGDSARPWGFLAVEVESLAVPVIFSDAEIAALVAEPKRLPADFMMKAWPKPKRGHRESELKIEGTSGSNFILIMRMGSTNQLDFSIILAVQVRHSNRVFRLRRYNGRSHEHTNRLERNRFYDFHIHAATERYQALGVAEDGFAERTTRFSDFSAALECLIEDCGCEVEDDGKLKF